MDHKRMVEELLCEKTPVPATVPKKGKRQSCCSTDIAKEQINDKTSVLTKVAKTLVETQSSSATHVSEMSATPAQQETLWPAGNIFEGYPQTVYGHPGVVDKDHTYAPRTTGHLHEPAMPSASATQLPDFIETQQSIVLLPSTPLQVDEESMDTTEDICTQQGDSDADYTPGSSDNESDDSDDIYEDNLPSTKDRTYLVFESSLEQLMKRCQDCGKAVITIEKNETGSMVTYELSCLDGHTVTWRSQPFVRQASLGNLILAAAVLFTGLTYKRLASMAQALNLAILKKSTFDTIQRDKLFPVIQEGWLQEKAEVVSQHTESPVSLSGDCRCDSPGHNAKYGGYTLMESNDKPDGIQKIVNIQLVQCTEVANSNQMEPEGLQRALNEVISEGVKVKTLATDRHVTVRKILRTKYAGIDHQFDVWHVSKGITTKLKAKATTKANADLLPWIPCITNHFWWSCATCNGDAQELRERWISILHHVTNKHTWTGCIKFKKCRHPRLKTGEREKAWLKPNSPAFKALQDVVLNKYLLASLPHLVQFHHTGDLEVFHNQLLKYCPKRQHFGYRGMMARTMLAALDWNTRDRQPVLNEDGTQKMDLVFSKRRKSWVLRKRYKRTSGRQVEALMQRLIETHIDNITLPPIVSPVLPANISRMKKPDKAEAVANHKTRFRRK